MTEQPECKCIECNLPDEGIEKLGWEPPNPVKRGFLGLNAKPEQPNPNIIIVTTIRGLMTCVRNDLNKLNENTTDYSCNSLVDKALREADSFEQTTLELQKAFE